MLFMIQNKLWTCKFFLFVFLYHSHLSAGQFDENFTLQNIWGRLQQQATRSMIHCISSDENPAKIKFSRRLDTGQGIRFAKFSQQFIQGKPANARILWMPSDDGLNRFGAYQCKVTREAVTTEIVALKLPPLSLADFDAKTPYLHAHKGDDVQLEINVLKLRDEPVKWRHNGVELNEYDDHLNVTLTNVNVSDSGIYECYYKDRRKEGTHAIMRLIVRGCPEGYFGENCNEECPPCYNGGICHEVYGVCVCPAGFTGVNCQQACGSNRFGPDCSRLCTLPENTTDKENGCAIHQFCKPDPYGCSCAPGFKGPQCMDHCEPGWYGADCKQPCHCAYGIRSCNRITGFCSGGCADGYRGESCEIEDPLATAGPLVETTTMMNCPTGTYGPSCEQKCHCAGNQPCHISTGQCLTGCEDGWDGPSCGVCSSGRFGEGCEFHCHCEGGNSNCDPDGYCYSGCEAGWAGFTCQQECMSGRFGQNCALTCHCFSGADACDKITGTCTGDCEPGYMGKDCQTLCPQTSYGINCQNTCSCYNGGRCNRIDGTCDCEGRWRGQVCNESAPQILAATDVEANSGHIVFMSCTADAIPKPEMRISSSDFPDITFNVRSLDKNQYQAVVKMKPQNEGVFEFSCSAKNIHGFDSKIVSLTVITPPKLLSVPELLEVTNTSIAIKWKPWTYLVDFGGKPGDKVEYLVLWRESSSTQWKTHDSWKQDHAANISNLVPYTEYQLAIKCRRGGSGGEGGDSPYLTVRTKCGEPSSFAIPQAFLSELIGSDFVKLSWQPPSESALRCKLIGYVLVYKEEKNSSTEISVEIKNLTREINVEDLTPNTVYHLHLYPVSSYGQSTYAAELIFVTTESVPGPVQNLQSESLNLSDTILVSWKEPSSKNGILKSYNVTYQLVDRGHCSAASSRDLIHIQNVPASETKIHIKDLFPYSLYNITVSGETSAGEGPLSYILASTAEAGPDIGPTNLHVISFTSTSVDFAWDPIPCESANGIIIEYEYSVVKSEFFEPSNLLTLKRTKRLSDTDVGSKMIKTENLNASATGLEPYTEYGFAVRAHTKAEPGPFSEFLYHRTKEAAPPSPRWFMIDSSFSHHLVTSWFRPLRTNGIIIKYQIEYWPKEDENSATNIMFPANSESTNRVFGNISRLQPASDYILKLRASTNAGWGEWSKEILGRTKDDIPEAPTDVKVTDVTETSLELSWEPPEITNGVITGYKVTYNPLTSLDLSYIALSKPQAIETKNTNDISIKDLHPSTQYSLLIQAQTSAGYGSPASFLCWTTILGDHVSPSVESLNNNATNESVPVMFSTDGKSAVFKYQVLVEDALNKDPINESLLSDYETAVVKNELPYYIAAELDPSNVSDSGQQVFIVGDKKIWGGYQNVHLNFGHAYRIRIRTLIRKDKGAKSIISEPKQQLAVTSLMPIEKSTKRKLFIWGFPTYLLISLSVLTVLIIIIFFIILALCRKRKNRKKSGQVFPNRDSRVSDSLTWSVMYKVSDNEASDGPLVSDGWKYSSGTDKSSLRKNKKYAKSCQGIRIENLSDYLTNPNGSLQIAEEFKKLVSGQTVPWTVARKSENLKKNRYGNILPYDRYRVILKPEENSSESDYINASYVDGYGQQREYIVTQGPLDNTIGDFWRMVWQEKSPVIIMLTDLVENGKKKCSKYWPDSVEKQSMDIQNIQILLIHSETCSDFIIRTILVRKLGENRTPHRVMQYQFTGWPDRTVPTNPYFLLKMIKRVRSDHTAISEPMIVHCSAGAGRSGTYIALDALIRQAAEERRVDIFRFVNNARMQRINLVQTLEQYLFIHEALLEAINSEDTAVPLALISLHLKEMRESGTSDPKSLIRRQFQLLKSSQKSIDVNHCNVALSEHNIFKNRDPMTVPADTLRIRLLTDSDTPEFDDYINAVFVDGYHQKNAYLVTQMPMQHTVENFLQLIYQHRSSLILMLDDLDYDSYGDYGQYWPNSGSFQFGNFEMSVIQFEEHEDLVIRIMSLINLKEPSCEPHKLIQLQYKAWRIEEPTPDSACSMLALINIVELWYQRSSGGPITVHCTDGAFRCGLFCAAVYVCQQLIAENSLDVYQAVKNIRICRPEFVSSLDQFAFCFEVANELVSSRAQNNSTQTHTLKGLCHKI